MAKANAYPRFASDTLGNIAESRLRRALLLLIRAEVVGVRQLQMRHKLP
jgi:hypothetical protein